MRTRLRVYTGVSHVVEHRFPEPSCSGLIEAGRWRANICCAVSLPLIGNRIPLASSIGVLKADGVRISMDGKGRWLDNVYVERL